MRYSSLLLCWLAVNLLCSLPVVCGKGFDAAEQLTCIQNRLILGGNDTLAAQLEPTVLSLASKATVNTIQTENIGLRFPGSSSINPGMAFGALDRLFQGSKGYVSTVYERCEYEPTFEAAWYFDVPVLLIPQGRVTRHSDAALGCLTRVLQFASGRRDVLWSYNISNSQVGCFLLNVRDPAATPIGLEDIAMLLDAYFSKAIAIAASANRCAELHGASSVVLRTQMACPSVPLGTNASYRCLGDCVPYMNEGACCGVPSAVAPETVGSVPLYLEVAVVVMWVVAAVLAVIATVLVVRLCRAIANGGDAEYVRRKKYTAGDFRTVEVAEATASVMVLGLPNPPPSSSSPTATCAICGLTVSGSLHDQLKQLACGDVCHVSCLLPYVCTKVRFYDALKCPDCGDVMFPTS